jgi:CRP-like cAMP-binding protein
MTKEQMLEAFHAYLEEKKIALSDEQLYRWTQLLVPKKIKKNEFLLHQGEVCRYVAFVVKGCLRQYAIDAKGHEHIMQFAPENWWISDMDSMSNETPSTFFIDAIEDSEVLLSDKHSQDTIMEIPAVALFFQRLIQNRQAATQKRMMDSMSAMADERYYDFLKTYPLLSQRLPQHMIAAYLGITPESLSRIRKNLGKKADK